MLDLTDQQTQEALDLCGQIQATLLQLADALEQTADDIRLALADAAEDFEDEQCS